MLDVSPRSLQRLLMEQGTTFSRIVERSRRQSAFQLLVREDLSVTEVAEKLGYSDPSNFGRAFRKWTGQSPNRWRKRRCGKTSSHTQKLDGQAPGYTPLVQ
jgi:AraC-like DNA-binding protein